MLRNWLLSSTLLFIVLCLAGCVGNSEVIPSAMVAGYLDQINRADAYNFESIKKSREDSGVVRELVSFRVDGLNQYALVLWPAGQPHAAGWPLLMFNHGFHPDPPNYGRIEGVSARPGSYYWGSAQAYVKHGYVVVVADYRGHNDSDALDLTVWQRLGNWWSRTRHGIYKPAYGYTRDAIAAYFAAVKLPNIDSDAVYMVGHSMGGGITQRTILALGNRINAASVWSTSGGHLALEPWWEDLQVPLHIQHGQGDESTSADNSKSLAAILNDQQKPYRLRIVETEKHLFASDNFEQAVEQDLLWFRQYQ